MADPIYPKDGVRVIRHNLDPAEVAEEFIIHEVIKMFPEGDERFYDQIRYHVRQYRKHYRDDRFWRLVAGLSDTYMFKGLYRMFKGTQFTWVLAEVELDKLYVKMLSKEIAEVMKSVDFNVGKAGEILRKMPGEERLKIIDPFDFSRDIYPVIMHEDENGELVLHDGNRRVVNAAVYALPTIKAYVGFKNPAGKPALREDIIADLFKLLKDGKNIDQTLVLSLANILYEYKKNYINGQELVDSYIRGGDFKHLSKDLRDILTEVLQASPDEDQTEKIKNGNGKVKASHGLQPSYA